jgi:hypothetical protein
MRTFWIFGSLLVLLAGLTACNLPATPVVLTPTPIDTLPNTPAIPTPTQLEPAGSPQPGAPTPTASATAGIPSTGGISLETLLNFTYRIEDFDAQVTLQNGVADEGDLYVQFVEPAAFGDLNGDGQLDAAVVLRVNSGGSGNFVDLIALLNQNRTPVQAGFTAVGDRQRIVNLQITDGRVVMDYFTHSLNDPSCCPSEHRLRSYILESNTLRLASEQVLVTPEEQATPLPNAILIDQPAELQTFTNPLPVSGRVSQVPPESTLVYYITDRRAALLAQGEVPLEGEVSGPGTFNFDITLEEGLSPSVLQLELVDSADGFLRGRSMVLLLPP